MDLVPTGEEDNDKGNPRGEVDEFREQPKALSTTTSSSSILGSPAVFLSGVGLGTAAALLILNKDVDQVIGGFFQTCKNQVQQLLSSINQNLPKWWKKSSGDSKKEDEETPN